MRWPQRRASPKSLSTRCWVQRMKPGEPSLHRVVKRFVGRSGAGPVRGPAHGRRNDHLQHGAHRRCGRARHVGVPPLGGGGLLRSVEHHDLGCIDERIERRVNLQRAERAPELDLLGGCEHGAREEHHLVLQQGVADLRRDVSGEGRVQIDAGDGGTECGGLRRDGEHGFLLRRWMRAGPCRR